MFALCLLLISPLLSTPRRSLPFYISTRDCTAISSALCCQTLPIIESSSGMTFSCFRGSYFALAGQMKAAGISAYNNNWSRIHDFTKNKDEPNFTTSTEVRRKVSTNERGENVCVCV